MCVMGCGKERDGSLVCAPHDVMGPLRASAYGSLCGGGTVWPPS